MFKIHAERHFDKFEDVTPEILHSAGVKLLLCDLDNTLRLHSEKQPADSLIAWVDACRAAKVEIVVISNNGRKKFVQKFCQPLGVKCVWWAHKPLSTKLTKTMRSCGFAPSETVMLGDKWSTDILAAHFAGIRAWKVKHRRQLF